jgi:hypothetical protein
VFELVVAVVFGVLYYLLTRETGRIAIVVLPDQDTAYSRINEDQPQKFGTDQDWEDDVWLHEGQGGAPGHVELGAPPRGEGRQPDHAPV